MELRGEVLIMFIVLLRIIVALYSFKFIYEGIGLSLLSLMALFVESIIGDKGLQHLKPRLGASPGIFLGAVTMPVLLVSRLVQSYRFSLSMDDPKATELQDFRLEFWAVYACSIGMLLLLFSNFSGRQVSIYSIHKDEVGSDRGKIYSVVMLVIPFCFVAFSPYEVVVLLLHAAGCASFFMHIFKIFPGCASLGEVMLVASGIIVYFGDAIAYSFGKVALFFTSAANGSSFFPVRKDDISSILQAALMGLLFVPQLYRVLFHFFSSVVRFTNREKGMIKDSWQNYSKAAAFYLSLGLSLMVVTTGWLYFVQGLQQHPVIWVMQFVFEEPIRLVFCGYWLVVLFGSILPIWLAKRRNIEQILVRKIFHVMAVVMFIPALLVQQTLLKLAFCVVLCMFLVLEMIRVWQIPPCANGLDNFMKAFTDHRDSDALIISHFSLLLGCALPLWLSFNPNDRPLVPFAGVLSLGIGDTMASIVGFEFGRMKLTKSSKKTVEGTAAGIISMLLGCIVIHYLSSASSLCSIQWVSLITAVVCTGLMEAFTTQLDNAFIPLVFFALLNL